MEGATSSHGFWQPIRAAQYAMARVAFNQLCTQSVLSLDNLSILKNAIELPLFAL